MTVNAQGGSWAYLTVNAYETSAARCCLIVEGLQVPTSYAEKV